MLNAEMNTSKKLKHEFIAKKISSILFGAGYGTNIICNAHKVIYEMGENGRPIRGKVAKILEPRPVKRIGIRKTSSSFINNFIEAEKDYRKETYKIVNSGNGSIRILNTKSYSDYILSFHHNTILTLEQ